MHKLLISALIAALTLTFFISPACAQIANYLVATVPPLARALAGAHVDGERPEHRAADVIRQFEWVTRSPDKDGAIVVKQAENGLDKSHAGEMFSMPLVDCTKTPTRGYFGLGTPEQERAKRRDYQQRLDEAAARRNMTVETWCPAWAGTSHREKSPIDDEWSAFDARC